MPPRNRNNNPDNNPYGKDGFGFRNVAERREQLNKEFDALKNKEVGELEEILEKQKEVFENEKEWLEKMMDEVERRGQMNRVPADMPLDFELEEAAQNDSRGLAETICNNNEKIDKMVKVRHDLKWRFPFLENVTFGGGASDDGGEPAGGRDRDGDRGRERGSRPEERANRAMEAVAHWYEEAQKIKEGEAPMEAPSFIQEQENNEDYRRLADPRKVGRVEEARRKWERIRAKFEPDTDEAVSKLKLADDWLKKLEEKADDQNSDLADLKAEFNKIGAHPNAVFQAREFIRNKNLANKDKIKPENNRMEKRLEEIEKKIKEREKEKLKAEVKEVLDKLNAFLAEIQKQPGEFGPRFDTVEKRSHEWDELLAEIQPVLVRANAVPTVIRELRTDLLPIKELRTRTIPEALAAAALRTARDKVLKAEEILNSLKTYDDLINKIKEHKTAVEEGGEVSVLPNELINDTDVDDWLKEFNRRALEETNNAREFLDQHGFVDNPNFIPNIENLNKEIARYEDLLEKKMAALREAKHRARVREAVTSKAAQKGAAKRAAMFPGAESVESERIDIDEIKKNEVWGQVINVLLSEHGFLGREKGGSEARVAHSEASIIQRLQHEFGPDSPFHFTNAQCEDLFYAAKSWLFERLSLQVMGERRQAMPEAAEEGVAEAKPAPAEQSKKDGRWKTIALKALGWTGLGLGAAVAAPALGFSALAGFGAVGALRVIDNIRHHVVEHRRFNQEKQRLQGDEKFRNALVEHLSFTVANLRENNLRQEQAHLGYNEYFQNIRQHLAHENDEREKPLSEAELDKTAAAFAVFYETDDRIERERRGAELNRSANSRHWWEYIDAALGQAVRGGVLGKGWQISNPSRRMFSGSAWLGASFGLMACRDVVPGLKHALRAYAGWKIGGAATDWWAGRRTPENVAEEQLNDLEASVPRLAQMNLDELGEQVKILSGCRAILNAISNPMEYARQKERLKEVLMAILAEKILKEEAAHELAAQEQIIKIGRRVAIREVEHFYTRGREQQVEQEARVGKYRIYGRVLGAAGMMVGGLWLENFLHDLFSKPIPHGKGGAHAPEPVGAKARVMEEPTPTPRHGPEGVESLPPVEYPPVGPMPVLEDAVVHKGEGVEHALRRQIEANPEKWGYTGKGSVHRFAGHEAHRIASELGYVKGGAEVRVRLIDQVAYILDKDSSGRPVVDEVRVHKMPDDSFMPDQPIAGGTSSGLDEYEYGYHKPSGPKVLNWDTEAVSAQSAPTALAHEPAAGGGEFIIQGGLEKYHAGNDDYYLAHYGHGDAAGTLVFDDNGHRVGYVDNDQIFLTEHPVGGWPVGSPEHIDLDAGVAAAATAEAPSGDEGEVSADAGVAEPDGITREFENIKAQAESGQGTIVVENSDGGNVEHPAAVAGAEDTAVLSAEEARALLTGQYVDSTNALNNTEHLDALKDALDRETTHALRLNGVDYKLVGNSVNFEVAGQTGIVSGKNIDILRDFHEQFKNSDPQQSDIDGLKAALNPKK